MISGKIAAMTPTILVGPLLRTKYLMVNRLMNHSIYATSKWNYCTANIHNNTVDKSIFLDAVKPENLVKITSMLEYLKAMSPRRARKNSRDTTGRCYAVLIPFCIDSDGDPSILYTLRSRFLRRNGNQLSFPGGLQDTVDDNDVVKTALRETEEEIALPPEKVQILGTLPALSYFVNADAIHPILSFVDLNNVQLTPNPEEVESIHLAKLKNLVINENWRYTRWKAGWALPCYKDDIFNDKDVPRLWGLTAAMTHFLLKAMFPSIYHFQFDLMEPPYALKASVTS